MLFTSIHVGWFILGKAVPSVLSMALSLLSQAVIKTLDTVSPISITWPVNYIIIQCNIKASNQTFTVQKTGCFTVKVG